MHARYLIKFSLLFVLGLIPIGVNYLYLYNAGEFRSIKEIINYQNISQTYRKYGTAIHNDTYHYKLEGYKRRKPDVVAIGSSRVMQFRDRFFSKSFYNTGGAMTSLDRGRVLLKELFAINHRPKLIILGIDFWWFNPQKDKLGSLTTPPVESQRFMPLFLFKPVSWVYDKKIDLNDYFEIAFRLNGWGESGQIGVNAINTGAGFGPDGAWNYYDLVSGSRKSVDDLFKDTLLRIKNGNRRFQYGEKVPEEYFDAFIDIIGEIESQGVELVIFIPPLAPEIYAEMQKKNKQYGYVNDLFEKMEKNGVEFYNFNNPESIKTPSCEFVDGFHGGDVSYARILKEIFTNSNELAAFINWGSVENDIKNNAGLSMIKDKLNYNEKEMDFLGLGCQKY